MIGLMRKSAVAAALLGACAYGIDIDFTKDDSIKSGASTIASGLVKYYTGNEPGQTPGILPLPYFWWESAAFFDTLLDYWSLTSDDTYNNITSQGLLYQVGPDRNFMPPNQTNAEGNDDQGMWAMAALRAAEKGFPSPPNGQPQWLDLAKNVFNNFVSRWDTSTCGGGLRWQILTFNAGYDYKNSVSNGVFFDIASRLYGQTKNETFSNWAEKIFDWESKNLMSSSYQVYDGVQVKSTSCNAAQKTEFTLNAGIFLHGSAVMYNLTQSSAWETRVSGFIKNIQTAFFRNGIAFEVTCESTGTCNTDLQAYKGFLLRSLAETAQLAPFTASTIRPLLESSAKAAASSCSGSPSKGFSGKAGTACGFSWTSESAFDGVVGVGEQMNALSAVISTLNQKGVASSTNGTSPTSSAGPVSSPTSTPGGGSPSSNSTGSAKPNGSGGKISAGSFTTLLVLGAVFHALLN